MSKKQVVVVRLASLADLLASENYDVKVVASYDDPALLQGKPMTPMQRKRFADMARDCDRRRNKSDRKRDRSNRWR